MARMQWIAEALRDADLEVIELDGWRTRGADTMNPQVVIGHHTATGPNWSDRKVAEFLRDGRSDLAGPLAQLGLDRAGRYWLIAAGKANHAGRGSWKGHAGNSSAIGIEAFNDGRGEPWPQVQLDAYDRGAAALLRRIGKRSSDYCGHREWTTRKPDPYGIDLDAQRARIAQHLAAAEMYEGLTPREIEKLRALIWSFESVGSNPSFPIYTIDHVRKARKT